MKLIAIILSLLSFSLLAAEQETNNADLALITNGQSATTTAEQLEILKKQVEKLKEDQLKAQQLLDEEEKADK